MSWRVKARLMIAFALGITCPTTYPELLLMRTRKQTYDPLSYRTGPFVLAVYSRKLLAERVGFEPTCRG